MSERQNRPAEQKQRSEPENKSIGTGKKVGLYSCGFLILAIILLAIFMFWIGYLPPSSFTEGVGP